MGLGLFIVDLRSSEEVLLAAPLLGSDLADRGLRTVTIAPIGLRSFGMWWELHGKNGSNEFRLPDEET